MCITSKRDVASRSSDARGRRSPGGEHEAVGAGREGACEQVAQHVAKAPGSFSEGAQFEHFVPRERARRAARRGRVSKTSSMSNASARSAGVWFAA